MARFPNPLRGRTAAAIAAAGLLFGCSAQSPAPSSPSSASPSPSPSPTRPLTDPAGRAPAELTYPMGTCGEPNAQDGSCIPVADYGALAHNLTGAQIAATWDSTQTEFDGAYTLSKPGTDAYGNAVLTTTGAASNETQVDSSNGAETRGWTQTYGIVSAAIYLPSCGGHICSFPAFWWSSPDSRDAPAGDANVWPKGGEFDIFESTGTGGQSHYHADRGGNRVSSVAGTATPLAVPGWHIFTGVWEKDYVAVYFDGVQVMEYSSKAVAGNVPLELILDNSSGVAGPASADYVGWVQDYAWSGGSPD